MEQVDWTSTLTIDINEDGQLLIILPLKNEVKLSGIEALPSCTGDIIWSQENRGALIHSLIKLLWFNPFL